MKKSKTECLDLDNTPGCQALGEHCKTNPTDPECREYLSKRCDPLDATSACKTYYNSVCGKQNDSDCKQYMNAVCDGKDTEPSECNGYRKRNCLGGPDDIGSCFSTMQSNCDSPTPECDAYYKRLCGDRLFASNGYDCADNMECKNSSTANCLDLQYGECQDPDHIPDQSVCADIGYRYCANPQSYKCMAYLRPFCDNILATGQTLTNQCKQFYGMCDETDNLLNPACRFKISEECQDPTTDTDICKAYWNNKCMEDITTENCKKFHAHICHGNALDPESCGLYLEKKCQFDTTGVCMNYSANKCKDAVKKSDTCDTYCLYDNSDSSDPARDHLCDGYYSNTCGNSDSPVCTRYFDRVCKSGKPSDQCKKYMGKKCKGVTDSLCTSAYYNEICQPGDKTSKCMIYHSNQCKTGSESPACREYLAVPCLKGTGDWPVNGCDGFWQNFCPDTPDNPYCKTFFGTACQGTVTDPAGCAGYLMDKCADSNSAACNKYSERICIDKKNYDSDVCKKYLKTRCRGTATDPVGCAQYLTDQCAKTDSPACTTYSERACKDKKNYGSDVCKKYFKTQCQGTVIDSVGCAEYLGSECTDTESTACRTYLARTCEGMASDPAVCGDYLNDKCKDTQNGICKTYLERTCKGKASDPTICGDYLNDICTNTQKTNTQKTNTQGADTQGADTQGADTQEADIQKGICKTYLERTCKGKASDPAVCGDYLNDKCTDTQKGSCKTYLERTCRDGNSDTKACENYNQSTAKQNIGIWIFVGLLGLLCLIVIAIVLYFLIFW